MRHQSACRKGGMTSHADIDAALKILASAEGKDEASWGSKDWEWDSQTMVARRLENSEENCGNCAHAETDPDLIEVSMAPASSTQKLNNSPSESSPSSEDGNNGVTAVSDIGKRKYKGQRMSLSQCQADGCNKDMSLLSYYHKRNRCVLSLW